MEQAAAATTALAQSYYSRELQSATNNTSTDDDAIGAGLNDGSKLRDTFIIYGSVFVIMITLFSVVRRIFPQAYNVRNVIAQWKTYLAQDQYGFYSWIWKVCAISEDQLLQECGLDATCFVRIVWMGFKISMVGLFNMIWLLPVYFTGETDDGMDGTNPDRIYRTTISHLSPGDSRLFGAVFASYIMFGYAMRLLLKEFQWYIFMRHRFLKQPFPHHYAVFIRSIPLEYRSDRRLAGYFEKCFSPDAVLEAKMIIHTPTLSKTVAQRDATLVYLEHALASYKKTGIRPRHKTNMFGVTGEEVDSIQYYSQRLKEQNKDVGKQQDALKELIKSIKHQEEQSERFPEQHNKENLLGDESGLSGYHSATTPEDLEAPPARQSNADGGNSAQTKPETAGKGPKLRNIMYNTTTKAATTVTSAATKVTVEAATKVTAIVTKATVDVTTGVTKAATETVAYVLPGEDGEMLPAGFVVFKKLSTVNAALQMVHNSKPFAMRVVEAPDPNFIFWPNTSRTTKDLHVGMLTSFALTAALCVFWTIPTAFFGSLSNAAAIQDELPGLQRIFEKYPKLVYFFEQLAPLLLVTLNALLPVVFEWITYFEGHISAGAVEAAKFIKLACFNIIQTFFVSALSGGVIQGLSYMLDDPNNIVNYMATTLPAQSVYFQQIILIQTVMIALFELFRIAPLTLALLRRIIGPRLTERERNQAVIGLRPLSNPAKFSQSYFGAQQVLFFIILFVYAPISPLTPLLTAPCFLFMVAMYRHQFIYIYPTLPDSGGRLWAKFVHFFMSCIFMAQLTIVGLLSLKKAPTEVALFIPLIIITCLFWIYINQRHFGVARFLPVGECLAMDEQRAENFDFSFLHGKYTQASLAANKEALPDPSLLPEEYQAQASVAAKEEPLPDPSLLPEENQAQESVAAKEEALPDPRLGEQSSSLQNDDC